MRFRRLPDLFVAFGVLVLAVAIGEGQHESARARERREPLLWQVRVFDHGGHLLKATEKWGAENEVLSFATSPRPRIGVQLLPLGLPNGEIDLELHLSLDSKPLPPLQGLHVTPGKAVELDVPGEPLHIELKAVRTLPNTPLVS